MKGVTKVTVLGLKKWERRMEAKQTGRLWSEG